MMHKNEEGEEIIHFLKRDHARRRRPEIRDSPPSSPPRCPRHYLEIDQIQRISRNSDTAY